MSFLWNWISQILNYLGLKNKEAKIIFLGLENAGKTTLLGMLKDGMVKAHDPTLHASFEELTLGKLNITAFDIGGHDQARRVWNKYYTAVDAIVFIIDASDRDTQHKSIQELNKLMSNEEISDLPIVVLGNKKDKRNAAGEEELIYTFGLQGKTTGKGIIPREKLTSRPVELFMTCIPREEGYGDGFRWLAQYL